MPNKWFGFGAVGTAVYDALRAGARGTGGRAIQYGMAGAGAGALYGAASNRGDRLGGAVRGAIGGAMLGGLAGTAHSLGRGAYYGAFAGESSIAKLAKNPALAGRSARTAGLMKAAGRQEWKKASALARASWGSTRNAWTGAYGALRAGRSGRRGAKVAQAVDNAIFRRPGVIRQGMYGAVDPVREGRISDIMSSFRRR